MDDQRTLSREVEVTLIPQGTPMSLPEGEQVTITHPPSWRQFYYYDS